MRAASVLPASVLLAVLGAGCSTLAPEPAAAECTPETAEEDCGPDQICDALIAGGICRDANLAPPLRYLGFGIEDGRTAFRAELTGCDREADPDSTQTRGIDFDRGILTQTFVLEVRKNLLEEGDEVTLDDLLPARFQLSQPSRLARSPSPVTAEILHPVLLTDQELGETTLQWPRYHPEDVLPEALRPDGFVLWTIFPEPETEGGAQPALRYQMLVPPLGGDESRSCREDIDCCPAGAQCTDPETYFGACVRTEGRCRVAANPRFSYVFTYDSDCNRTIKGRVSVVDDPSATNFPAVPGATVRLRHEDTDGQPPLGVVAIDDTPVEDRDPQCQTNSDCITDEQFCNTDTNQCELSLAGRQAGSGSTTDTGDFESQVYSYCDGLPGSALDRSFTVTVTPPSELALPTISFTTDVKFDPPTGGTPGDTTIDQELCIPSMGTPRSFTVNTTGLPVDLLGDRAFEEYRCCDISCLPADREAVLNRPVPPATCDGSTASEQPDGRMTSQLRLPTDFSDLWLPDDAPCLVPDYTVGAATVGTLSRNLSCVDGVCTVDGNIAAGTMESPREYQLRIESPVGSLLQSVQQTVNVDAATEPLTIPLPPRRLVRGYVKLPDSICDETEEEDGDCGSEGARMVAERLRMPTETASNTPAPYFHQISTFYDPKADRDGAYILPLDPGVWLVTALPQTGTAGGPAELRIVDLREGTEDVELEDFVLDPGILVTLDVRSFDIRSLVVPLDTGSWGKDFAALVHPARMDMPESDRYLDLNDPDECLSSPGEGNPPGCQIRRLIPGSSLPLTQVGQVRFTTREVGIPARRVDCAAQ